ncbi:MAG: 50S ribosomal protein L4 [Candidatus Zixiibacteriota bacterium]|nr:MAG: 50S ribosomal protein L4 [candidate division Zixibacteria bacterium]
MKFPVYNIQGNPTGQEVELPDELVQVQPNEHAMYLAVKRQLARSRQGTAMTKNRALVRGGGKRPWRQKGTGRARAGTSRSPIWRGGGRIFGPEPRDYDVRLPAKVLKLARRSAFAAKANGGGLRIVEDFKFDAPKTKELYTILKGFQTQDQPVIVLVPEYDKTLYLSARNIPYCSVQKSAAVSTYELIRHRTVLLHRSAVEPLIEVLTRA